MPRSELPQLTCQSICPGEMIPYKKGWLSPTVLLLGELRAQVCRRSPSSALPWSHRTSKILITHEGKWHLLWNKYIFKKQCRERYRLTGSEVSASAISAGRPYASKLLHGAPLTLFCRARTAVENRTVTSAGCCRGFGLCWGTRSTANCWLCIAGANINGVKKANNTSHYCKGSSNVGTTWKGPRDSQEPTDHTLRTAVLHREQSP